MRKILYIIPLFIFAFTFTGGPPSGWYQQFMPDLNGQPISDIIFLDSLTGFAITGDQTPNDTNYILKTTNGGDNWNIIYRAYRNFFKVQFLDLNTGYVCGGFNTSSGILLKTTDGGNSWNNLNTPGSVWYDDMSVLNEDTIWLVQRSSLDGGVFRTINGGVNWEQQLNLGSQNPNHIYVVNGSTGFIANDFNYLRKTTNSGLNWTLINGMDGFLDMHFINANTGWKAYGIMKKTTDGGDTWITQPLQTGGQLITSNMGRFSVLNKDTIWGVGGQIFYGGSQTRGVLWRTTNGGNNWSYQAPDTSLGNFNYYFIHFESALKGWAYTLGSGIHTKTGGDTIFTSIQQISSIIPKNYELHQNYPNPFNPATKIQYEIQQASNVRLSVYDISGKHISDIVNKYHSMGAYQVAFEGKNLTSGIYFYSLSIDGVIVDTKKMMLVK